MFPITKKPHTTHPDLSHLISTWLFSLSYQKFTFLLFSTELVLVSLLFFCSLPVFLKFMLLSPFCLLEMDAMFVYLLLSSVLVSCSWTFKNLFHGPVTIQVNFLFGENPKIGARQAPPSRPVTEAKVAGRLCPLLGARDGSATGQELPPGLGAQHPWCPRQGHGSKLTEPQSQNPGVVQQTP